MTARAGRALAYQVDAEPTARLLALADELVLPVVEVLGVKHPSGSLEIPGTPSLRVAEGGPAGLFASTRSPAGRCYRAVRPLPVSALRGDEKRHRTTVTNQATPTSCSWSSWLKESSNIQFTCPTNRFMVGRQHSGDENGSTRYYCCNLSQSGVQVPRSGICGWSSGQKESSSNLQCLPDGRVMVGRQHSGDENGTTWNYCCKPQW